MVEYAPVYATLDDPLFNQKLAMMEDFGIFKIPSIKKIENDTEFQKRAETLCKFEKTYYQHLVSSYISNRSPYRSLLLYHGLGSGKTCSAITIAETFLKNHRTYDEAMIWVVSKKALKKSFEQEIFRTLLLTSPEFMREQCTGDTYYEMIPDAKSLPEDKLIQRIQKIIKSRYKFFGYEKFANTIEEYMSEGTVAEKVKNKVIIVDEAHNIRNLESSGKNQKNIIEPFLNFIENGQNNRLIFLSATPMFNEPEEILWLMSLLMLNDKGTKKQTLKPLDLPQFYKATNQPIESSFNLIKNLSSKYISYIRGNNPFTFAVRIKAEQLGINIIKTTPKKTFQGQEIPEGDLNWLSSIKDGLVPSVLSGIQLQSLELIQKDKDKVAIARLRQLNNITYVKQFTKDTEGFVEGKEGIYSIFKRKQEGVEGISQLEYIKPNEPILNPAFGKLKEHAIKFQTIADLIEKSNGIVVIYSNFIWGGIVPLAIMLEHLGFSRYGESELLSMNKKTTKRLKFEGISNPTYCILSGENEKDVMGSSRIDDILKVVNDTEKNKNGKTVKVILMSPVASEGLTFKNVREMHILEPWFHLNTTEQAIGRAIRHCSHSSIPMEERNVSVFLHATVFPDNEYETADLHAYRLSAIKQYQIDAVDKVVKENSIDCSLMKNVNYFPKEIFSSFRSVLTTSHGTKIAYQYGDNITDDIKCSNTGIVPHEMRAFRKESYQSFLPTLRLKLQKYLKTAYLEEGKTEYTYEELLEIIHENKEVAHQTIEESMYPYQLWGSFALIYHYNKFIITEFKKETLRPTRIQIDNKIKEEVKADDYNIEDVLGVIAKEEDEIMATLQLYQALDSNSWRTFAEKLITSPKDISSSLNPIIAILDNNGSFVRSNELPRLKRGENQKYIGYINIFSAEDAFEGVVWSDDEKEFREIIPSEIKLIKQGRTATPFTDPKKIVVKDTIAMVQRHRKAKEPDAPYRFQFKLGLNNETVKRSGIVCDSCLKKPEIQAELDKFARIPEDKRTVSQMCFLLMYHLLKNKRMWIPTCYKPTS